jgi:predicted DNA-binding ribbon-helix-helix protein
MSGDASGRGARPRKRSITIAGHKTSISLEDAFWEALQDIAAAENCQVVDLIGEIDSRRGESGLSGAIRVYVLDYYRGVAGRARGMSSA